MLEHIAVFANSNGANAHSKEFIELFAGHSETRLTIVGLAEKLPQYTRFPAEHRKARLEELIRTATQAVVDDMATLAERCGITVRASVILEGRFPAPVVSWLRSHDPTLLVKESLPCDDHHGNASKGDIKLTRQSEVPVLLAHAPIRKKDPVVVGIAPDYSDPSRDGFWIELIGIASTFAKLFGGKLYVVSAWELWGENLIRSRAGEEEVISELATAKDHATQSVDRVVSQCDLGGVDSEVAVVKGNPTRVVSDTIDRVTPSLVILGSSVRKGALSGLMGATAESIAIRKETSVLIVK